MSRDNELDAFFQSLNIRLGSRAGGGTPMKATTPTRKMSVADSGISAVAETFEATFFPKTSSDKKKKTKFTLRVRYHIIGNARI